MTCSLLPRDGEVSLCDFLPAPQASELLLALRTAVPWQRDTVRMYGKVITTRREMAWYGDPGCAYSYSGIRREPLPWIAELRQLRHALEHHTRQQFNSCLLNLYHDGSEGMSWHSDDEPELGPNPTIASISLGAPRRFLFRHRRDAETVEVLLTHGSLLIMSGATQHAWRHSVPPMRKEKAERLNLTFRKIIR